MSHASLLAPIVKTLREDLDKAVEGVSGPGYQALKTRYGALKSVEKDVAGATHREAQKLPAGLSGQLADIASGEEVIRGIFSLNPKALVRGLSIQGAKELYRYFNSPNRAIQRLFQVRAASQRPIPPALGAIGAGVRGLGQSPLGAMGGGLMGSRAMPPPRQPPPREPPKREIRPSTVGP